MANVRTIEQVEQEIDRLISDKEKSEDKNIRKEIEDLKNEISDYKQKEVDRKVREQIEEMKKNNEISKAEYEQMIAGPDQD